MNLNEALSAADATSSIDEGDDLSSVLFSRVYKRTLPRILNMDLKDIREYIRELPLWDMDDDNTSDDEDSTGDEAGMVPLFLTNILN